MTDEEFDIQLSAKLAMRQEREIREEREARAKRKNQELQKKLTESFLPQSQLKLRPSNHNTQEKQRINRETILALSRELRNTHLPNPFVLSFQIARPQPDDDKDKKLRAVAKSNQQRLQAKIHHQKEMAAEQHLEQQHQAAEQHHIPTPRPR